MDTDDSSGAHSSSKQSDIISPVSEALESLSLRVTSESNINQEIDMEIELLPQTGFLDLPHEVFITITSYLDVKTVIVLSQVCRQLLNWLKDELFWKARLMRRWPIKFPALEGESVDWQEACFERETLHKFWENWSENMHKVEIRAGLSQCVDALKLIPDSNLLLIGGRDRYLSVYDTKKLSDKSTRSALLFEDSRSHKGWIWCIRAREDNVITTAWDERIRFWTFRDSQLALEREIKLKSSVLSAAFLDSNDCAVASTYDKTIYVVDKRQDDAISVILNGHRRAVLNVTSLPDPRYIISASEDKNLFVWDIRNSASPVLQYKFSDRKFGYPRCLAHHMQSQLWVGDSRGLLHIFRATPDSLQVEESYELSCIAHLINVRVMGQSILATASQREFVRIWHPTQPPLQICHFEVNSANQDLASMDFVERELVVGAGNGVVSYWSTKTEET